MRGQVFLAGVHWSVFVAIVGVVLGFGSSASLAAAYGIAVTGTMATTSVLAYVVTRRLWRWPVWLRLLVVLPLLAIDIAFFSSNLLKVGDLGWCPLLTSGAVFVVLMTWHRGRDVVNEIRLSYDRSLRAFIA